MEKFTNEELLEVLPSSVKETKELTTKQKVVLGQLYVYNGLDIAKKEGYFYRSNTDLINDCEIQEKTLIAALRKLEILGFIERRKGSRRNGASEYRLNEELIEQYGKDYCKKEVEDYSNDYSKQIAEMADRIKELEITVKMLTEKITVIETENSSTDTETEKDIETEKEKKDNIIEEPNGNKDFEKEKSMENLVDVPVDIEDIPASSASAEAPTTQTEEELTQQILEYISPCLCNFNMAQSISELDSITDMTVQSLKNYMKKLEVDSDDVCWKVTEPIAKKYIDTKYRLTATSPVED